MEQLVTFIQYVSDGHVHTKFLSIQNLLEHHKSANADAIVHMITQEIEKDNLQLTSLAGLASDGASVFTGSKNGVGVKLKKRQEEHIKEDSTGVMQHLFIYLFLLLLSSHYIHYITLHYITLHPHRVLHYYIHTNTRLATNT